MGAGRTNDIPNLTTGNVFIGNGSGYDKRALTSADVTNSAGYITSSSTDTLTNKSGSNSQWTNDAGYTTNTGTVTPSSTDTFTNKSGSNSQWTNDEAYLKANALTPYYTSSQVDALPVSTFSNDAGYSTTTGTVTPSSTDTFTNKSGNISQWTNDAGYLTSETDNQTLSFANPNLSISNGNSVDLSALNTTTLAWSAITSTPTTISGYGITDAFSGAYADLTGKPTIPTNNNQLTNGAGYTTNTGTVTPSSTDAFTNKSGSNSQWTNDEAYIKANSTETLTNKSGNISMFTNDANYSTTTGTVTPTSTDTFTNKSGSNSQWTNDEAYITAGALTPYYTSTQVDALPVSTFSNDAGYLTTETDSQTLSFTSPNLSISNGNSVDLSGLIDGGTY